MLLFGYSFTKRFTALCHLFLGLAIASGPAGAWIAVRGDFSWAPGLLMIAVGAWIAGFDILYALADRDFDRTAGLHSIPARFGVTGALAISALCHLVTAGALLALWSVAHLGAPYLTGVAVVIALLIYEHAIVRPNDLSRLNVAFFNLNGYVSVVFFIAKLVDGLACGSRSLWAGTRRARRASSDQGPGPASARNSDVVSCAHSERTSCNTAQTPPWAGEAGSASGEVPRKSEIFVERMATTISITKPSATSRVKSPAIINSPQRSRTRRQSGP